MKRILALILTFCIVLGTAFSFTSCDLPFINDGSGIIGGDQGGGSDNQGGGSDNQGGGSDNQGGGSDNQGGGSDNQGGGSDNQGGGSDNQGGDGDNSECANHVDIDDNDYCDLCNDYVIVVVDFYVFNDLHGKFCDTDTQPGVDEIGTYLDNMAATDDHMIVLSTGDMWQGTAESTLTKGKIMVEWMNALGFVAMTLGNHEFDWGEGPIRENLAVAEFPFLAINIYDNKTGELADFCTPSIMVEKDGLQIGIIGAIGDCYSSISSDKVTGVNFKVGSQLTSLIKAESEKLRSQGADLIVLSYHEGIEGYDVALSNGYVDLVFEGHTHSAYVNTDSAGIYHLQGGGENSGLSHVEIAVNKANGNNSVNAAKVVKNSSYENLADHQKTEDIEDKYSDIIEYAYADLGIVSKTYSDSQIEDYIAQLYLEAGLEKWGSEYDIVLGGGFLRTRSPYDLTAGTKKYADLASLFPFDNQIVLCKISGSKLKSRFINNTNEDYHIALSSYGLSTNISNNSTYYVVVDTYTALYSSNGLTMVEYLDDTTFARDLLAAAILEGRLETSHKDYILTSIPNALAAGNKVSAGQYTEESYYIKGRVKSTPNATYGNLYLVDENGNEIYVYGLYDLNGKRYDSMTDKPKAGDTIVVYSTVYNYYGTIELKDALLIEINP